MAKIKGTGLDIVRRLVKAQGPAFEAEYLAKLPPIDRKKYGTILPVSWWDVNDGPGFIRVAAEMFFPGDPQGFHKMAKRMAQEGLRGIYRIFIQIPTPAFVLKRVAKMWRAYQDTGEAVVEDVSSRSLTLVVRGYPDMPAWLRDYLTGYIDGVAELINMKDVLIIRQDQDPQAWKWTISW